jgi:hypothetical protein
MVEKRGGKSWWPWSFIAIFSLKSQSLACSRSGEATGNGPFWSWREDEAIGFMLLLTWASKSWLNAVVCSEVVLWLFCMVGWPGLQVLKLGMRFAGRGLLFVELELFLLVLLFDAAVEADFRIDKMADVCRRERSGLLQAGVWLSVA